MEITNITEIVFYGLIAIGFLILIHELGHFIVARLCGVRVNIFSIGFGPKVVGFKKGDTEYRLSAIPLGGYVSMHGEEYSDETEKPIEKNAFCNATVWRRMAICFAGVAMNIFVAWILALVFLLSGYRAPITEIDTVYSYVKEVEKGSVAEKVGLKQGDMIQKINNSLVINWGMKNSKNTLALCEDFLCTETKNITMQVRRGSQTIAVSYELEDEFKTEKGKTFYSLGIKPKINETKYLQSDVWYDAFGKAFLLIKNMFLINADSIESLTSGKIDTEAVGGPISIISESGKVAQQTMIGFYFMIIFLSMALAFMNMLPLPPLDGGHIVFLAIEAVRGKPIAEKTREKILNVGTYLLCALMFFALYNDIKGFF